MALKRETKRLIIDISSTLLSIAALCVAAKVEKKFEKKDVGTVEVVDEKKEKNVLSACVAVCASFIACLGALSFFNSREKKEEKKNGKRK